MYLMNKTTKVNIGLLDLQSNNLFYLLDINISEEEEEEESYADVL